MPRPFLKPEDKKKVFPIRLRPAYAKRLKELAKPFRISPGDWVEAQLEPYMPTKRAE